MTSSDGGDGAGPQTDRAAGQGDAGLEAAGWQRCFIADEPRLSESVDTYRDLGFEVHLRPVPPDDSACTECMRQDPDRFRVIYVRKAGDPEQR